ncbi:MAG: hypothetical protein HKN20_00055 [Gemmatimonadetes bacterium]|nr:hypothetical protein [Gemmatimonadota bacterium]
MMPQIQTVRMQDTAGEAGTTGEVGTAGKAGTTGELCKFCGMTDCPMHSTAAKAETGTGTVAQEGPAVHQMAGVPVSIAIGGIVAIIIVSHLFLHFGKRRGLRKAYPAFDLLRLPLLKRIVRWSAFPMLIQTVSIGLFLLVIGAGLFGNQRVNIAPVLTWTWWWALLIFAIVGMGTAFCAICPWEGLSSLVTSLSLKSRRKSIGFELKWPRWLRNTHVALFLFIVLTWFELGLGVTKSPSMTALLAAAFGTMAIVTALVFERRSFCRYVCFVGRIQGLYALFAPIEVRPGPPDICRSCEGKECYNGSDSAEGCPTSLFPGALTENTYCTLCTECVRSCPHDNIALNVRPFGADLFRKVRFRWDEAVLALSLLALTSFHGLTMTPSWIRMTDLMRAELGLGSHAVFTILMALMMIVPIGLFYGVSALAGRLGGDKSTDTARVFRAFAYSVIPIALFYHLAHNGMHFFMEAQYIIPLLSDPFGWGWNLFGTAGKTYDPWMTLRTIWWMQITFIVMGHVFGVIAADRIVRVLYTERGPAFRALMPLIVLMILYSSFSVWLIAQPMEMRSGM